jgi:hypothetical protein
MTSEVDLHINNKRCLLAAARSSAVDLAASDDSTVAMQQP